MSNLMGCCITLMICTAKVRTFLKSAILRWKFSPPSQWCGLPEFRIKGKSRLVKSVAGPTGAVLLKSLPDGAIFGAKCMIFRTDRQSFDWTEKLPVGAFCPRKLAYSKSAIRDQREKQAGHLASLPWRHGNQDFIRDCFSDEWWMGNRAICHSIFNQKTRRFFDWNSRRLSKICDFAWFTESGSKNRRIFWS